MLEEPIYQHRRKGEYLHEATTSSNTLLLGKHLPVVLKKG